MVSIENLDVLWAEWYCILYNIMAVILCTHQRSTCRKKRDNDPLVMVKQKLLQCFAIHKFEFQSSELPLKAKFSAKKIMHLWCNGFKEWSYNLFCKIKAQFCYLFRHRQVELLWIFVIEWLLPAESIISQSFTSLKYDSNIKQ